MPLKAHIKETLLRFGYELRRRDPDAIGRDPYRDMCHFTNSDKPATLFDVGANRGQSIAEFRSHFSSAIIHSFEPSPSVFQLLKEQWGGNLGYSPQ